MSQGRSGGSNNVGGAGFGHSSRPSNRSNSSTGSSRGGSSNRGGGGGRSFRHNVEFNETSRRKTLYVGNLDLNVTELQLIKLFSQYGKLERVEFKWHKTGPKAGQPKGFAFVEFSTEEEAEFALKSSDQKPLAGRSMIVRFSQQLNESGVDVAVAHQSGTGNSGKGNRGLSTDEKIAMIEAKIRELEKKKTPPTESSKSNDNSSLKRERDPSTSFSSSSSSSSGTPSDSNDSKRPRQSENGSDREHKSPVQPPAS